MNSIPEHDMFLTDLLSGTPFAWHRRSPCNGRAVKSSPHQPAAAAGDGAAFRIKQRAFRLQALECTSGLTSTVDKLGALSRSSPVRKGI